MALPETPKTAILKLVLHRVCTLQSMNLLDIRPPVCLQKVPKALQFPLRFGLLVYKTKMRCQFSVSKSRRMKEITLNTRKATQI